ncbi:MAG TPA: glycosyltransferase [Sphingobacteriaceae bacterium]
MQKRPSFVTIFTATENFHLVKDVGQIPYFMYKTGGYDARLVSYRNGSEYPFLNKEVKGLKLEFIADKGKLWGIELAVLGYLIRNAKDIDVLNLFHFQRAHALYLFIYKLLNPKGKTYIKLDIDIQFFRNYNSFFFSNFNLKNRLLKILANYIIMRCDYFSVETDDAKNHLIKVYPKLKNKLICIPNGVDGEYIKSEADPEEFAKKENIIITVGRIGTEQKNTALLLGAIAQIELDNWKVYILGNIEPAFHEYIDSYFNQFPHLREKVFFTGNISDRKELFEWYKRSKIFCLSSRYEGFPITFPEALYFGNYIITTPVSSAEQITANGAYGCIVNQDPGEYARAVQEAISPGFLNENRYKSTLKYAQNHYDWKFIIPELIKTIQRA